MSISQLFTKNEYKLVSKNVTLSEGAVAGHVLTCTDASGNASWEAPAEPVIPQNLSVTTVETQDLNVSNSAVFNNELKYTTDADAGKVLVCGDVDGSASWSNSVTISSLIAQTSLATDGESTLGTASANSLYVGGETKLNINGTAQANYILSSTDASGTLQWVAPPSSGTPASVYVNTQSNAGNVLLPAGFNQLPTGTLVSSSNPADWSLGSNQITYLGATPKVFAVSLKAIFERTDGTASADSLSLFCDLNGSPLPSAVSSTTWIEKTQGNLFTLSDTIIVPMVTGNFLSFRVLSVGNNIYTNSNSGVPNTSISIVSLN